MSNPQSIIIVDDHAIVRKGIVQIIKEGLNFSVVEEVEDAEEFISKVLKHDYDMAVVDVSLPGRSGLDVLSDVKKIKPDLKVLVISMNPAEQYGVRALKNGAAGYLVKDAAPTELVKAIQQIMQGKKYISSTVAQQLIQHLNDPGQKESYEWLSDREMEVFLKLSKGSSIKEIAEKLSISVTTVSTYRSRILDKLALTNNAELVQYALKKGLIQ